MSDQLLAWAALGSWAFAEIFGLAYWWDRPEPHKPFLYRLAAFVCTTAAVWLAVRVVS